MQRIQTFDILRGFAIFAMVIVHRVYFDYYAQHGDAQGLSVGFFVLIIQHNGRNFLLHQRRSEQLRELQKIK